MLIANANLTHHKDGYWLYDHTRGMNIAMRAKDLEDVLDKVLTYYQNRLTTVETQHRDLQKLVSGFVDAVSEDVEC